MAYWFASSTPKPDSSCANISARSGGSIVSSDRIVLHELLCVCISCSGEPSKPARTLAPSVVPSTTAKDRLRFAASRACSAFAKKFGTPAVDKACALALEMRVHEYSFVKHYLQHCPPAPLSLQQVDPLIRNLLEYRDLIEQKTKEDPIP